MRKVLRSRAVAFVMAFCMMLSMISTDMLVNVMQVQAEESTWVDGTTVSTAEKGTCYYFDLASSNWCATEGTYGLMTIAQGSKNGLSWNGTTYGLAAKEGQSFTLQVAGNSYIVVSGDNNSSAGATITLTSENGSFDTNTLATNASGHCDLEACMAQGANSASALYTGAAGTVTLTMDGSTAYICAICIIPAADSTVTDGNSGEEGTQDPDGDGWVDGTTVSTIEEGLSYYFDIGASNQYNTAGTYGLMTTATGSKHGFFWHSENYGLEAKAEQNFTFQVPGNCYIVVTGDNNSTASMTATSSTGGFDTATQSLATAGHCDLDGCKIQGDNSVSYLYVGEAGTVTMTMDDSKAYINAFCIIPAADDITLGGGSDEEGAQDPDGDGWVDGTTVSTLEEGLSYYFDIGASNQYNTAGTYGLMTTATGSKHGFFWHSENYGLEAKAEQNFTFQVPGNCYIVVTGDNNSTASMTATSSTGGFDTATQSLATAGHCDLDGCKIQGDNSVSYMYTGSVGTVTMTMDDSKAYINAFCIIPMENQDPDGDGWVDGTTVSTAIKGNSYYFDIGASDQYNTAGTYGLMTTATGSKHGFFWHSENYGLEAKAEQNFTFQVPGNCYIVVTGDNNSTASMTATSSTGGFDTATQSLATAGHCDLDGCKIQGDNSVSYLYVGEAGTVTMTMDDSKAYINAFCIIPAADDIVIKEPEFATVSGTVDASLNGENLVFSDGEDVVTVAIADGAYSVELEVGATYTVAFEKGVYVVTSETSIDLTEAAKGDTKTLNITYEELSNRLVVDAAETIWNLLNKSFGAYASTASEWYSGDGLVVSGKLSLGGDGSHGAATSTSNSFAINVPAGLTTITFNGCQYDSKTVLELTCGAEVKEVSLIKEEANVDPVKSVTFSNKEDATISIAVKTGGGYLHSISAKTETEYPKATISGTVDGAVNGEVLNFMKDGATVATATIEDGAYSVELSVGSEYTVAFANAAVYEIIGGKELDLTETEEGSTVTNNITYTAWDAGKAFTLTLGDTQFTVTPGTSKAEDFTVVVNGGSGFVELVTPNTAIAWTDLQGLGGGVLSANMITGVSDNITTSFNGNILTITYKDATTNPTSYEMLVKDNSATGEAVADGTPLSYNFVDGSIVSKLYDGSKYVINNGKTIKSADGLVALTGNKKIYYNGSHGIVMNQNDTISVNVAGDATISMVTCLYTNSQKTSEITASADVGTITPASQNFTSTAADGEVITFEYVGEATTLVFTYTSSGSAYLHSMSVKNHAAASDVAKEQEVMPQVMTYGTPGSLEATPVGQRYIFTQTGGQMNTDETKGAINSSVSYFGFPATTGKYKLEADVVLSSCGASNYNGIYFGAFDENNIASVAIRNSTGLRGILSKSSLDMAGASTIDTSIENGQKVHYTVERTDACFVITVTPEDGKSYTMEFDYNDSGVLLFKESGVNTPISYGFAIAGSSAIITNMKYYDENGNILYDQNDCYAPVGTAPIVSAVSAEAAQSREYISVNWTSSVAVVGDGRYVVQVSKDGSEYTTISETTDTSVDYPITEAGEYTFRVAGKLGEEGETNTWVYADVLDVIAALTKPVVSISSTASSVSLSWDAVDKAISYEVYRYSFDEGEENASKIATLSATSYADSDVTAEMPYYYNVVALSADNYSNPSETVWTVPSAGHTGEYVYEDEATEIFLTKKSYDTVFDGKAVLEGVVMGSGTMEVTVNGTTASEKTLSANDAFSLELELAEGRNDVNILFTDANGKVTRETYNFVYLTNYDMVVDAEYTGTEGAEVNGIPTYGKLQSAVDSVSGSAGAVILVMAGSYEERLVVNTPNISIIGEDREATLVHCYPGYLGSDYEAGEDMSKRCATYIQSGATGFSAENISFANDYVYSTPDGKSNKSADAIRVEADQTTFVNVKFSGVQDTLYMHSGHQYYYKCVIEGLVDFIYSGDDARSFFNDCEIVFVYESTKKGGYVCAPRTAEDATYGLTFYNCVITAEEGCAGNGYLLARPWGPNAYITWIDCYMGSVLNKYAPYNDMSGNAYTEARFFEFGSYGPGYEINIERRQISPNKAAEMITDKFLGWAPATVSVAVAAKYIGDVETDKDSGVAEDEYTGSDKYQWTDGDDTGLAKYNQEGYAESYGVSGGGLLLETSDNYYKVANAEEFLEALISVKESGKSSVIELTADINLGCNEIENFDSYSAIIEPYKAQPLTHPTLMESGVSVLAIEDMYNFTIFSQNGASIKHANITMKNAGNIIIRNVKFDELWEWDEETNGNYDRNDWDFMTIDSACNGIWIDHCTFYKAYDGIVDMKNPDVEMNVTVSWCEFLPGSEDNVFFNVMMDELQNNSEAYPYYTHLLEEGMTGEQIYAYAYGQKKTHLLGQSDSATNAAGIRATFANNVYTDSMDRMPRVRYGVAHVYNCIMDAQNLLDVRLSIENEQMAMKVVSNGASSTCGAQVLLENCYISGIQNALNSGNGSSPSGYINAVDSVYYMNGVETTLAPKSNSTTDSSVLITDADAFVGGLTYSDYVLCDAEALDQYVTPYAGAGKLALTVLQWEKASYNDSEEIVLPTPTPTTAPEETSAPTGAPEVTSAPTSAPEVTSAPTGAPEVTSVPTVAPEVTSAPTSVPEVTSAPTSAPEVTSAPTSAPEVTSAPTAAPEVTSAPTAAPEVTSAPTVAPEVTSAPTAAPEVTAAPTQAPSGSGFGNGGDNRIVIDANMDWREVDAIISGIAEGEDAVIEIVLGQHHDLPASLVVAIQGRDITLSLVQNNGVVWEINGLDVERAVDLSLRVVLDSNAIAQDRLGAFDGYSFRQISLLHNGDFGFKAKIKFPANSSDNGKYANLFYDNNGRFEFMGSSKIAGGYSEFTFTHASDYVLVISDTALSVKSPTTGDELIIEERGNQFPIFFGALAFITIFALGIGTQMIRRKEEE